MVLSLLLLVSVEGLTAVFTKTGAKKYAGTDGDIEAKICNSNKECCSFSLDKPNYDDRKEGAVDVYADASILGDCYGLQDFGSLTTELTLKGSDGWYVDWLKIDFPYRLSYTYKFDTWLDDATGYSSKVNKTVLSGS